MTAFIESKVLNNFNDDFLKNIKIISVFGHNVSEVLMVTKDDTTFGFGQNEFGVLGFGHNRQVFEPKKIDDLSGKGIISFVNGCRHVIGVTKRGKIFCWGRNDCSQLGNGLRNNNFNKPEINEYLINEVITDISCGESHSLVLTEKNELFVWGSNDFGQIGNGSDELFQLIPFKLNAFNGENIIAISCGFHHSLALTDKGHVYSWGYNDSGQLGDEEISGIYNLFKTRDLKRNRPKLVKVANNKTYVFIEKINCGFKHSMLLSRDGDIYTFGDNMFGQIGDKSTVNQTTPQNVISSVKYKTIASHFCYNLSIALSVNNTLFIWGKVGVNSIKSPTESQLKSINHIFLTYNLITYKSNLISWDFETTIDSRFEDEEIQIPNDIYKNSIKIKNDSNDFSLLFSPDIIGKYRKRTSIKADYNEKMKISFHFFDRSDERFNSVVGRNALFATEDSKIFAIGSNCNGLIGFNHKNLINEPMIVNELCFKGIIDFANGYHHMIARTDKNQLYIWGYNGLGQLGNETFDDCFVPQLVEKLHEESIVDICCGVSHTLALTENGNIYAWGWNKFGQIGNDSDNSCQSTPFKILNFNDQKIIAISCGAHHSIALTECGRVYGWGRNDCGQLGFTNMNGSNKPQRVRLKNNDNKKLKMKKISCGYNYSLLLTIEGDIYGFGSNSFGQLANECFKNYWIPTKIINKNKFIDIASHYDSLISVALSVDNIYYIWGDCGHQIITEPKTTNFDSFNNIFIEFKQITYNRNQIDIKYGKDLLLSIENKSYYKRHFQESGSIAVGTFGVVSKAKHENENEIFAIKRIAFNVKQKDKVLKEIEIISQLKCDFVVNMKEVWIEDNYLLKDGPEKFKEFGNKSLSDHKLFDPRNDLLLHIQMELCFKSLKEIIKMINNELNSNYEEIMTQIHYYILSELFTEILESVNYLHKQNPPIIHRDIKPENILITHGIDGRFVKLCDFGFAKLHEFDGQSHSVEVGVLRYMAPEVFIAKKYYTKADIYSIAVVIQELFKGFKKRIEAKPEMIYFDKYKNISALVVLMKKEQELRPNCESILNQKKSWDLNINDIKNETQLKEMSNKSFNIRENFHSFFMKKKLEISEKSKYQ